MKAITCYQRVSGYHWTQEWYESASGDARRRAAELRKMKLWTVTVSSMGSQVTSVGRVNMTLVDIRGSADVPMPETLVRI